MWNLLRPFLASRRNIIGTVCGLAGFALTAGFGGFVWLPFAVGFYIAGYRLTPALASSSTSRVRSDVPQGQAQMRESLDRLLVGIQARVAEDIYARVVALRDSILATMAAEAAEGIPVGDPNAYLIRQTAIDYLPAALAAYVALPRVYAEQRIVSDGLTSHGVLVQQLDLMTAKMKEMAEAITEHDSDRLLAHGRFLADKFAPNSLDVEAPAPAAVAAPIAVAVPAVAPVVVPAESDIKVAEEERERVR